MQVPDFWYLCFSFVALVGKTSTLISLLIAIDTSDVSRSWGHFQFTHVYLQPDLYLHTYTRVKL